MLFVCQVSFWPRGKVLGGTSVLNYMLHVRGRRSDYERWEKQHKLAGWGWKDVAPFYAKLESFLDDVGADGDPSRGQSGPIATHRIRGFGRLMEDGWVLQWRPASRLPQTTTAWRVWA